jgi:uncharacterized iron-regulated protein
MRSRLFCWLWAGLLGILILGMPAAEAASTDSSEILQSLASADVMYLGETHDRPEDHQIQLEILQTLYQQKCQPSVSCLAIALEMFQRPDQDDINQYLAGTLTEQQLLEQTQYQQRWGFPWEYYAPILRFAKEHQLPVLALNTPTEVTHKVARQGLESLTPEEQTYIPPLTEIRTDNPEYRQMLLDSYQQHQGTDHASQNFERFFTAQVLWDETMAEGIAQFLKTQPNYQLLVLVGQAHIAYGYGIPSRVNRRLEKQPLIQRSVLLSFPQAELLPKDRLIADFIWHL